MLGIQARGRREAQHFTLDTLDVRHLEGTQTKIQSGKALCNMLLDFLLEQTAADFWTSEAPCNGSNYRERTFSNSYLRRFTSCLIHKIKTLFLSQLRDFALVVPTSICPVHRGRGIFSRLCRRRLRLPWPSGVGRDERGHPRLRYPCRGFC